MGKHSKIQNSFCLNKKKTKNDPLGIRAIHLYEYYVKIYLLMFQQYNNVYRVFFSIHYYDIALSIYCQL